MKVRISNPDGTALLATPGGDFVDALPVNEIVDATGNASGEFIEVKPAGAAKGWIAKADSEPAGKPAFDPETFVAECLVAERTINARTATKPWFISADFLIARALIETNLADADAKIPGSDGVGPLQVTTQEWKSFLDNGGDLASGYQAADVQDWLMQVWGAAWRMFTDAKAITDAKLARGIGKADDPPLPTYLEVFLAYLTNSPKAAAALFAATSTAADKGQDSAGASQAASADADKKLKDFLTGVMSDADIATFCKARATLTGPIDNSNKVSDFVAKATKTLNDALKDAFDKIAEFAPDEVPQVPAGSGGPAPWLAVAKTEEDKHVKSGDPRVLDYFKSINFAGATANTAWCAAFASFCMKTCGDAKAAASVPAHDPALAASWRSFGNALPLNSTNVPIGAVVVLAPSQAHDGSGHVAFFLSGDASRITLLGGNQSHQVKESTFARTQVVAIQWLDTASAGAATGPAAKAGAKLDSLKPAQREIANLIISRFAQAGYGNVQQIAAVANAKAESDLNPNARTVTSRESSFGLFQCNTRGGLGSGHSEAELLDPNKNIDIILAAASSVRSFKNATTLKDAVDAFVDFIERPADRAGEKAKRLGFAQALMA